MLIFCIVGFFVISGLGSLFHFVYEWSNKNKIVAFFVAVNESTWEHLKLAIFPTLVWIVVGLFFNFNNYLFATSIALVTMCILIPTIFYTYTFITKKSILAIDILSFFVSVGLGMFFAYKILAATKLHLFFNIFGGVIIAVFVICFSLFTYFPPKNFLFKDPTNKKYGIPK